MSPIWWQADAWSPQKILKKNKPQTIKSSYLGIRIKIAKIQPQKHM